MLWGLEQLSGVLTSLLMSLVSPFTELKCCLFANIWPDLNLLAFFRFSVALRISSEQFKIIFFDRPPLI